MKPHLASLVFLLLAILPMFFGHLPPLTSYRFVALILFSVLALSVQLPQLFGNSLPESIRFSITFNSFRCYLKTPFPNSF